MADTAVLNGLGVKTAVNTYTPPPPHGKVQTIFCERRTTIDFIWPQGHSVNAGILKNKRLDIYFKLHYPSVDNITAALNAWNSAEY